MRNSTSEKEIIRKLPILHKGNLKIKPLKGGMTNNNYLVVNNSICYVARFAPEKIRMLGLNRQREIYNYRIASSLKIGPRFIAYYPAYKLLIVDYIHGKHIDLKTMQDPTMIKKLARLLYKLHHARNMKGSFNPFKRAKKYIRTAKKLNKWLPKGVEKYFSIFRKIERLFSNKQLCPCHLDLMRENIIQMPNGGIKLIDWEYASNADYRYDLAMLSVKGNFDFSADWRLVKEYRGFKDVKLYRQIQAMKAAVYFAEASYGIVQFAISNGNIMYKDYALLNLKDFQKVIPKIELDISSNQKLFK